MKMTFGLRPFLGDDPRVDERLHQFDCRVLAAIIRELNVGVIAEFGVSDGLGMFCMGRGRPIACIVAGLDDQKDSFSVPFRRLFPKGQFHFYRSAPRSKPQVWLEPIMEQRMFDLAHVNDAQTYEECRCWLNASRGAVRKSGHIVVSGYAERECVRDAVVDYLYGTRSAHLYLQTIRGHMLIHNNIP